MALRRSLSQRLFTAPNRDSSSPITTNLEHAHIPPSSTAAPPDAVEPHFNRQFLTSPGFLRRFLQHRVTNNSLLPSFTLKLREKLNSLNPSRDHRLRLAGLNSPPPTAEERFNVSTADAKKVLRFIQLEKVRESVRNIPASTIHYGEFVRICCDACGNRDVGSEFAKTLDQSGDVIVLGDVVFLHPDQVAKSMENLMSQSIAMPNDPRRQELAHLETEKALIDQKAQSQVRRELYFGLGFLALQTVAFMRLTFWELSWDVMEPICFFVTSFQYVLAYVFFLRTYKEPTFDG
ncbi:hypothetical protein CDL12_23715 [Handroanthus impetiginosus]|uniref:Calcium uniporter protein C-terminal domain-containing protein n=1 Tax=Handroanthus impetiginosus TaxID=429701 RepID=A0A2G9GEY8_9LAMI|nr:hypothetical protein CDL12_23715 [Handroanthus impetiginosus]